MKSNDITIHMMVKNEDRFIWYSLMSVLPYATKVIVTDTGSTDNTVSIIKSIKSDKIELSFREVKGILDIASIRQENIEKTKTSWFWVVDGDEIYTDRLCNEITSIVSEKRNIEGIVVGRYDLLGDVYHYQNPKVGAYNMFGVHGHNVLRLVCKKNLPGLKVSGVYPFEGYYDSSGKEIITHSKDNFVFTKEKMWHGMYLRRSSRGANLHTTFHRNKYKIEWGLSIPKNDTLPEVFSMCASKEHNDVLQPRGLSYSILAGFITPIKMLKRVIFSSL